MEIVLKNYTYNDIFQDISYTFKSGNIYGLYGGNSCFFDKLVIHNLNKDLKFGFLTHKNDHVVIIDATCIKFYTSSIKTEINYYCKKNKLKNKSFKSIIEKYFSFFGFCDDDFNKQIFELSYSEKILFYIFINTLFEFDVIFFKNVFFHLDRKNQKIIGALFTKLKKENKLIFINDLSIDLLYTFSDYLVYFDKSKLYKSVYVKDFYNSINDLVKEKFDIPNKLYLIYLAKSQKNIKLTYLNDIRDIIKDIYKHV